MLANGDHIAVLKNGLLYRQSIQKGAVFAIGILEYKAVTIFEDGGMVAGYGVVINDQMMIGVTADGEGVYSIKGELFDRSVFEFDQQSDHLAAFASACTDMVSCPIL